MRNPFYVPEDTKVSEKQMRNALIATVCSVLLCMSCMVGSAWAWFTVDVELAAGQIAVGSFAPEILVDGNTMPAELLAGTYTITVNAAASETGGRAVLNLRAGESGSVITEWVERGESLSFTLVLLEDTLVRTDVCWGIPVNAVADGGEATFGKAPTPPAQEGGQQGGEGQNPEGGDATDDPSQETTGPVLPPDEDPDF